MTVLFFWMSPQTLLVNLYGKIWEGASQVFIFFLETTINSNNILILTKALLCMALELHPLPWGFCTDYVCCLIASKPLAFQYYGVYQGSMGT